MENHILKLIDERIFALTLELAKEKKVREELEETNARELYDNLDRF